MHPTDCLSQSHSLVTNTILEQDIGIQTKAIIEAYRNSKAIKDDKSSDYGRPNVIHQMLDSPDLPALDKSEFRLALEIRTFVGAGTETTGNTLSVTTYHLLANPQKAQRLKEEVQDAQRKSPTPLKYQDLLQLPYLVSSVPNFG